MKRLFADAFFYIALLNRSDAAHARAMEIIASSAAEVVTTIAVLLEVADAMAEPARRMACAAFLREMERQPQVKVRELDRELWTRALELYGNRHDKEWSLTDCISFVVMADEGLTEALTGDRHFEQAGFVALLN